MSLLAHVSCSSAEDACPLCFKNKNKNMFNKFIFPQTRKKVNLKALTVKYYSDKFTLSNSMSTRRYICLESDRLKTFPYGYHPQMLDE